MRQIVLALDGSQAAHQAFELFVSKIMDKVHDEVRFLTVTEDIPYYGVNPFSGTTYMPEVLSAVAEKSREEAQKLLAKYAHEASSLGIKYQTVLLQGNAREAIADYVEDRKPHLVIVGSRGLGAVQRTLIGSVSDYLLQNVQCPLLIVKCQGVPEESIASAKRE